MSLFRKLFVFALLGFLVGAGAGAGFAYWQRLQYGSSIMLSDAGLKIRCAGGSVPHIVLSWDTQLTPAMSGLERSIDGGSWTTVFSGNTRPTTNTYNETGAKADAHYQYRVRITPKGPYTMAQITTDQQNCSSQ